MLNSSTPSGRAASVLQPLDVLHRALADQQAPRVELMQRLGAPHVDLVLRALQIAHEAVAVAVVVDVGREGQEARAALALVVDERRRRAGELHAAGIVADVPFAALDVFVRDDAHPLLLDVDPAALAVLLRPALDVAARRQQPLQFLGMLRIHLLRHFQVEPLRHAEVAGIAEVRTVGARVVEEAVVVDHLQRDLGVAAGRPAPAPSARRRSPRARRSCVASMPTLFQRARSSA